MINLLRRDIGLALALGLMASVAAAPSIAAPPLEARTSDADGVQVVVTPKSLDPAANSWDFEVVLDTHTKPLNDDMMRASELIADGRPYAPLSWLGDPPGGHHRKGSLSFSRPAELPKVMEIRINGIGGGAARTFRWELQ